MSATPIVVCEKSGQWATALRMAQRPEELSAAPRWKWRETRSLLDCRAEAAQLAAGVLVLEATPLNADGVLRLIIELKRSRSSALMLVVGASELEDWANLFCEAGAALVITSPGRLDRVWKLAEQYRTILPRPAASLRDSIWARLPWRES